MALKRKTIFKLLLLLASTLFALLVLEVGMRIVGVSVGTIHINRHTMGLSDNPKLVFGLTPGGVARAEVEYRINEHGMRNPPVTKQKPEGTRRVAVIGDSIAFGYWVPLEHTLSSHLEQILNEHGRSGTTYEVLNFGVPGYNLEQEIEVLRSVAPEFEPDAVVFAFCMNDLRSARGHNFGLVNNRLKERERAGPLRRLWLFLLDHSMLCAWIEYRKEEFRARREFTEGQRAGRAEDVHDEGPEAARRELEAGYREAAALLEGMGVPGFVVIYPPIECADPEYPHLWIHEAVAETAGAAGLEVVDLLDAYRGYPSEDLFLDPVHPGPLGNRIAAHLLFERMAAGAPKADASKLGDVGDYRAEDFPKLRGY
jgi:lysophospholipase L1-like esterase